MEKILAESASWGKEQYDFIYQTHYKPQVEYLRKKGIDVNKLDKAEKKDEISTVCLASSE